MGAKLILAMNQEKLSKKMRIFFGSLKSWDQFHNILKPYTGEHIKFNKRRDVVAETAKIRVNTKCIYTHKDKNVRFGSE